MHLKYLKRTGSAKLVMFGLSVFSSFLFFILTNGGVVMWEILEEKNPYFEFSNQEVLEGILKGDMKLPKPTRIKYPNRLDEIMVDCFQRDRSKRPTFEVNKHQA